MDLNDFLDDETYLAELEHRIGYSDVMDRVDATKAHAVRRRVVPCDEAYAQPGVTDESIRVVGG